MGQDLRDCHALWKRRVDQKVTFINRGALGKDSDYTWIVYKAQTGEKFEKISSGKGTYNPKYFGIYQSHTEDTNNTAQFKDNRANIFKTSLFRYVIPGFTVLTIMGVIYLYNFLTRPEMVNAKASQEIKKPIVRPVQTVRQIPAQPIKPVQKIEPKKPEQPEKKEPLDYFDKLVQSNRVRLSGIIENDEKFFAYIDILDSGFHLKERLTPQMLTDLGWKIERKSYGLKLTKKDVTHIASSWPVDPFGVVSQEIRRSPEITGESGQPSAASLTRSPL